MRKYQTFGKRFIAGIIDGALIWGLSFALEAIFDTSTWTGWYISQYLTGGIWIFYVVFCIGKYGQTIGKYAMGIKVYQLDEQSVIGYKRAFYRECVPIFFNTVTLLLFSINLTDISGFADRAAFAWFILELVSMLSNDKRRAVHDFLASSVVVDVAEQQREMKELPVPENVS